jgi:iron complex outermembrane recepter protein
LSFKPTPMAHAIAIALLAATLPVQAQTAPEPASESAAVEPAAAKNPRREEQQLERVEVTATRRAEPVYRIPFNISAIDEAALRETNITDPKKLIEQAVSINTPNNGPRYAESVVVRGLSNQNVGANELDYFVRTSVAYYIDDTPLPNLNFRIKDINRVETLIGPQGTLYGAASLGGTIRYITNKPQLGKTEGAINLDSYHTKGSGGLSTDPSVMLNVPIGETVAIRASLSTLNEKGWTDRLTNAPWRTGAVALPEGLVSDDNTEKTTSGRISAQWQASPDLGFTLSYTAQNQDATGSSAAQRLPSYIADGGAYPGPRTDTRIDTPFVLNDHTVVGAFQDQAERKLSLAAFDADWNLGYARMHSSTSYYTDRKASIADITGFNLLTDLDFHLDQNGEPWAFSAFQDLNADYRGFTHETRLVSQGSSDLSWIAGFYYSNTKKDIGFSEILPGFYDSQGIVVDASRPVNDLEYSETNSNEYRETALYGEVGYRLSSAWQVNLGARVFHYKDKYATTLNDWVFQGFVDSAGEDSDTKSFFKFNTSYAFAPDQLAYFTASQGWRRGGANSIGGLQGGSINPQMFNYKPDETTNFEIGFKGLAFDRDLYYSASIFRINWKDSQDGLSYTDDATFLVFNGTLNGPDSHSQGVELMGRYRLTDTLQLTASTAYTQGEIDEDKTVCITLDCTNSAVYAVGDPLLGFPKWKSTLGLRYSTFLDNGANLRAGISGLFVGEVESLLLGERFKYDSYNLYNAFVGYGEGPWEATLWIENIANERVVRSHASTAYFGRTVGVREFFNNPRTVGLQLSYRFE